MFNTIWGLKAAGILLNENRLWVTTYHVKAALNRSSESTGQHYSEPVIAIITSSLPLFNRTSAATVAITQRFPSERTPEECVESSAGVSYSPSKSPIYSFLYNTVILNQTEHQSLNDLYTSN